MMGKTGRAAADAARQSDPMTDAQALDLKALSEAAFEPEAYKPHLTSIEAAQRINALRAKLRLLDEPPHTL
jgi:hypothetical protein